MSLGHITLSKNRGQPRVAGEGVYFRMMRGRHEIKCLVTRAALAELAGHPLEISQLELVYFRHYLMLAVTAKRQCEARGLRNKVVAVGLEEVREAMSSWPRVLN